MLGGTLLHRPTPFTTNSHIFFISTAKDWNALLVDSPFLSFLVLNVYIVADRKRLMNNKKQVSQAIAGNWRWRVERLKV